MRSTPSVHLSLLLGFSLLWLSGCSWTVRPPAPRAVDAVPVFLSDYGWHSSLLLPVEGEPAEPGHAVFMEYVIGDWGYAAKGHTKPWDAFGALTVSHQAALGRRLVNLDLNKPEIHNANQTGQLVRMDLSRKSVDALLTQMDERYREGIDPLYNPINGQTYVKVSDRYSWTNSCNTLTKQNVAKLGCRVSGLAVLSNFKVVAVPGVSTGTWQPPVSERTVQTALTGK
jgi:hypothetical protein